MSALPGHSVARWPGNVKCLKLYICRTIQKRGMQMTYYDYLKTAIFEVISNSTNERLLDYIYTILMSASLEEKLQANS